MEDVRESEKLSRKEKEHLFRRKEILEAALKLFATKGYDGASMQEIAAASEFSIGTLYNFFSTKEELYLTLIEEKILESREWVEQRVKLEKDPLRKIYAAIEATLTFMENNREFFLLFLFIQAMPNSVVHKGIHERILNSYEKHVDFFRELMEECEKEKLLRDFKPEELAMSLIGITHAWIYRWLSGPGDKDWLQQHERIMDLFLNGARVAAGKPKK